MTEQLQKIAEKQQAMDILIVDDDSVDRTKIKYLLAKNPSGIKYNFDEADWGREAIEMLQKRDYDCVFLDCHLPDADGLAILQRLYNPHTGMTASPVVMMTGQGNETIMIDAFRLGAQDYLIKENINAATINIALSKAREMHDLKKSRQAAEQELTQVRKMEAIGQLTSGIAHDFNNLLTVVIGNVHLLRRRFLGGFENYSKEDIASKIEAIDSVSSKGAELVRRMMLFTRQGALTQDVANLNDIINETIELLKRTLGAGIEIETGFADDLWPVLIDASEFQNMLINFSVNARDAMPGGGSITIETENVVLDDFYTLRHPDVKPGEYIMIAISDTGTGMSAQVAKRIFEPFFTTKPVGEGTGLGMSMAYGFIRQSGGHIHIYSEEGHGTVFRIYLPKTSKESTADTSYKAPEAQAGRETILVVEDDEDMRALAINMLMRLGYRTIQAANGRVALEILNRDHQNIDLVFTDIMMPGGVNGNELATYAHKHFPKVKILFATGYTERTVSQHVELNDNEMISKPYRREILAAKLRKVLDEEKARDCA